MNFLQWFKGLLSVFDLNAIQFPGSRNTGLITQEAAYLNNNAGLWVYYSNLLSKAWLGFINIVIKMKC